MLLLWFVASVVVGHHIVVVLLLVAVPDLDSYPSTIMYNASGNKTDKKMCCKNDTLREKRVPKRCPWGTIAKNGTNFFQKGTL